jgi:hypothetical protein
MQPLAPDLEVKPKIEEEWEEGEALWQRRKKFED